MEVDLNKGGIESGDQSQVTQTLRDAGPQAGSGG